MDKFWDKIKDFLYDSMDYLLIILVIAIVAGIIGWRLDVLFDNDLAENASKKDKIEVSKNKDAENNGKAPDKKTNETEQDNQTSESKETEEMIIVTIPKGSTSQKITHILLEKKLIKDKEEFLETARKLQLETKLKYGEFEIKPGSTYEEILKIMSK